MIEILSTVSFRERLRGVASIYMTGVACCNLPVIYLKSTCYFSGLQFDQFVTEDLQVAFEFDGLVSSHPIYVPVANPDEINEIFDKISYSKVRLLKNCSLISIKKYALVHYYFNK